MYEEYVEFLMEEFVFLKKEVVGKDLLKGLFFFIVGLLEEEWFGFFVFSGIFCLIWLVFFFGEFFFVFVILEE